MPIIPTIIDRSGRGERVMDIFSRLLEERIIFLAGPIDDHVANLVIAEILLLTSKDNKRDIKLYINSPGGSVTAGLAIYDTMQYVSCDVTTICVGMAASMAAVLLAAGAKGKRYALPNSEILLHQPMGGITGQASEIEIGARQILKIKDKISQILVKHIGKPLKTVEQDTDRDFYLSAKEAKEYGVVDEVIAQGKN
ncbi:ATP-dependent Clp protease proteolytic subunit [bacterium (Candidatus Gribaldobacteria) CG_4_10_14_0_2_um_filter_41_16]|uniref:ATP-dependent Clp protease proteolytic subunit n=3 Tax=Candidatus Gribaldobacteria TaxID=2798536 RepID=A0A2M7VJ89_9BACT|nr:MAG: ATP-dependent Clp protease proteolytic subunit [bacterium (Candidatus Gribaldobacteria) CG10_big_fil_rev_8_21_14_0_10_41_12]PIV46712.1 MAG: ATP-dependent Clp protease proteolytic subunit [bacterium (Candidatus Gribaldobacteria) CG02_land_8_20_14_3_00_41_15]PJA01908.1 MAG: ATP-dependent Clp protease proteolytic subunit [bacterium (Candidatus Gribaldobacteria) CG_4_10_14_0_2_um_filter_41_16]